MPNKVGNVISGKPLAAGGIYLADLSETAPTTVTAALPAGYESAGYIGEDGVTEGGERSTTKIKAWGGDVVKVVQDEHSLTYAFTFIESTNATVLKAIYGDENVTVTPATSSSGTIYKVDIKGEPLLHKKIVFEIKDGNARIRISAGDAQVIETGEITYSDSDVISYPVTVECFSDENGVKATKWLDDGVFSGV